MIATFFLIFAFLRSIRWSRRRAPALANDEQDKSVVESKDKLSSLGHSMFSRSDSSATTTSSSGVNSSGAIYFNKRRGDSTASTTSTSVFSETAQDGARRSSDGIRATGSQQNIHSQQHRRSSGRIRRFAGSRTTIAGARRRTTGRFATTQLHSQLIYLIYFVWLLGVFVTVTNFLHTAIQFIRNLNLNVKALHRCHWLVIWCVWVVERVSYAYVLDTLHFSLCSCFQIHLTPKWQTYWNDWSSYFTRTRNSLWCVTIGIVAFGESLGKKYDGKQLPL